MEVKVNNSKQYSDIACGSVFMHAGEYYLRTNWTSNAVNIRSGLIRSFPDAARVRPDFGYYAPCPGVPETPHGDEDA